MSNQQTVTDQEESEKCLRIAQKHLLQDDHQTALHYLYKSQQIFPSDYVKGMIDKVEQLITVSEENGRYEKDKGIWEGIDLSQPASSDARFENESEKKNEFTDDQLEAVRRINQCRDYYEILGIDQNASEHEMKRQYRKLALQYHPDKNSTPGASDAFKNINSAFDTLSDPQKRRYYDLYGRYALEQSPQKRPQFSEEYFNFYSCDHDSGLPPEEVFHMFCGSRAPHEPYDSYEENEAFLDRDEDYQTSELSVLLQIMPVIVFVCISIISSYLMSDPVYSLSRNSKYQFLRKTSDLNIPYFVKENFIRDYRHNLKRIEEEINQEYVHDLTVRCFRERNYRENLIRKAKNIGDAKFEEKAKNLKTPSCSDFQEIQRRMDN